MLDWILSYPVSCGCFSLALLCLLQAWLLKKDFFSPANVYCFSQSLTLGIAYLKLNKAMSDFQLKTWLFWIGAMIAFCIGSFCVRMVWKEKNYSVTMHIGPPVFAYNWKLHFVFSCLLFALFIAGIIFGIVNTAGNLLLLTGEPAKWMTKYINYGYWPLLFCSSPLVVMFFGVASFESINPVRSVRILSRILVVITIALNILAYPNRGTIFFCAGALLIFFNYLKKRISPIWILFCLLLAALAFVLISSLRSQYGATSIQGAAVDAVVDLPYKYTANNYWNFDYAINPPVDREYHPHTYGLDFFAGIFEYLRLAGSLRNSYGWDGLFNERIEKVKGLNTASYLWEVYKDMYTPGVFLFPLLCGLGLTFLHAHFYLRKSPVTILFYTMFIYLVGWWFFTPGYKQGIYWIWGLLIFIITRVCSMSSSSADQSAVKKVSAK